MAKIMICFNCSEEVKTYIKYVESLNDDAICCVDCAKEFGFKTKEETDSFNYNWWKSHYEERIGKKITDEAWAVYYPKLRKELDKHNEKS